MKNLVFLISFLFSTVFLWSANPVPYSGKIAIRGVNYFGDAQFTFSLQDKDGKTRWRNGKSKDDSIKVNIRNGHYTVLLGGQGMNALPPQLFLDYDELYLKVRFDNGDGKGLRHLAPEFGLKRGEHVIQDAQHRAVVGHRAPSKVRQPDVELRLDLLAVRIQPL